ncbi:epoxyqueuosine reductase [Lacrimispora sp.]|uniref:epoxyqueuosine reductase n=1 Tax=Lacrimispora sp. TaxID=2719234 RepID=UPI002897F6B7|nr:epoxyqueuosine reductase [Lacrimispora sp.]
MNEIEKMIQGKAYELGYEKCGIIPLTALREYEIKFEERLQRVPQSATYYERHRRLTQPEKKFTWAKSVVVVTEHIGKYRIPESLNTIAKFYLCDTRADKNTQGFQTGLLFEEYMRNLGFRVETERKFGLVGLRWAAIKAGLGVIRRNNFFYTESGSWVTLYAWLIDKEMELLETSNLPACPKGCNRCIQSCPSNALSEPYTLSPTECVSYLTTFGGRDLPNEPLSRKFGNWIYGCDTCQDVCPMNRGKWQGYEDFPGLAELAPILTPEKILTMDENLYKERIQPKFFYLSTDDLWKWKVNALSYMRNHYKEEYQPYIIAACGNENIKIREMSLLIRDELNIG